MRSLLSLLLRVFFFVVTNAPRVVVAVVCVVVVVGSRGRTDLAGRAKASSPPRGVEGGQTIGARYQAGESGRRGVCGIQQATRGRRQRRSGGGGGVPIEQPWLLLDVQAAAR